MESRVRPHNLKSEARPTLEAWISTRALASRWACSRSTVDRVTRHAGLPRLLLGEGKRRIVRYRLSDVEEYEQARTFDPLEG